jgi:hypothetical protein
MRMVKTLGHSTWKRLFWSLTPGMTQTTEIFGHGKICAKRFGYTLYLKLANHAARYVALISAAFYY